jgi:hypothetical protein
LYLLSSSLQLVPFSPWSPLLPLLVTFQRFKDGETLALTDGTVVRLINAKAPVAPLVWRGDTPWPVVSEAKDALLQLASHAEVGFRDGGTRGRIAMALRSPK